MVCELLYFPVSGTIIIYGCELLYFPVSGVFHVATVIITQWKYMILSGGLLFFPVV